MQYILLLRGVNVGGRNIKMDELKSCFEKNGFGNVHTILQTGNVILTAKEKNSGKLAHTVESMLEESFHYPARVLALEPVALQNILDKNPFTQIHPDFHRYILFTKDGFEKTLLKDFRNMANSDEKIQKGNNVVYWTVRKGMTLDSPFAKYFAKAASREFMTTRNVNTLEKILAKCGDAD